MCAHKQWFSDLDEDFQQSVKLGNDSKMVVLGKGTIRLQLAGIIQVITDVFYIPELRNNLLSIGQMQERGVVVFIKHGVCKLYHPDRRLIVQTECLCCMQQLHRKLPTVFKQLLKTILIFGTADMDT